MINSIKVVLLRLMFCFIWTVSFAHQPTMTLDLKEAELVNIIQLFSHKLKRNVIISPNVSGSITLHLEHVNAEQAFAAVLASAKLAKWVRGQVWFIAPPADLLLLQKTEFNFQKQIAETSPILQRIWQIKYAKARDIATVLTYDQAGLISKRGYVKADDRTNILYVRDTISKLTAIAELIKRLDIPVQQILIEARIASIDCDFERDLGISYHYLQPFDKKENSSSSIRETASQAVTVAIAKLSGHALLDVRLNALERSGHAELISRPSLFTENQQTARIEAGEEVPYQEISESGGTAVTFKKAVLGLEVTPQILPGGKVLLRLQVSQDRPSNRLVLGVPTISTRKVTTTVLVKAGQTVVLGGIYERNREISKQGIPIISRLPVLGWLFKKQNTRTNKRALFIFVTPKFAD